MNGRDSCIHRPFRPSLVCLKSAIAYDQKCTDFQVFDL